MLRLGDKLIEFDVLVVGAGPAAGAALIGLDQPGRLGVVTGASSAGGTSFSDIHAKIRTIAGERREAPGIIDPISIEGVSQRAFSTAITGGLANYWGQQFVRYAKTEPWPRTVFHRYQDYQAACTRIEAEFRFEGTNGPGGPNDIRIGSYRARNPRLLVGTKHEPEAGFSAMRRMIERQLAKQQATTIDARVELLASIGGRWVAKLSDGSAVSATRILLAAGVLGTAALLMRSFPDISSVRLRDHAPMMLYTVGLDRLVNTKRPDTGGNGNVQTLQHNIDEAAALFATVYNLRYVPLNLILGTVFGRFMPALSGRCAPWPLDWITPVQVWTNSMTTTVEIDRARNTARVVKRPAIAQDPEFARFMDTLRDNGVTILKVSETPPLQGFHYFGLEVATEDEAYVPIEQYLAERTMRQMLCVDPAVLQGIGCRPHTETAMASAMQMASSIDQPALAIGAEEAALWERPAPMPAAAATFGA